MLRTIAGVGPRTSEAVMAYMDDPERFTRNQKVGSYFGLVPCQDQSADRNRLGHITRQGPATERKVLTEAAWPGIRRSAHLRGYFHRIQGDDPSGKRIALSATAHYLARAMQAMLRAGECWPYDGQENRVA
ncbi:MAG: IS110 family transposase [Planctomycetes bacterium]|nr:IS110 family transposase [Planctomycetota bacterium]